MKKNGFTLIELLAVIVILAIIAVITVPKVAEMIDSSRKGTAEDSFYGTLKAAELGWSMALQQNPLFKSTSCEVKNNSFECASNNGTTMSVNTSGAIPKSGIIYLSDGGSATVDSNSPLMFNGYKCYGNLANVICTKSLISEEDKKATDTLKQNIVTSGDGLYADAYEAGRYVYKGANPSNYLTFNNENAGWRIVSIENDGTIKIVRNERIPGTMAFDSAASDFSSGPRLNSQNTYCQKFPDGNYYGCNAWNKVEGNYINGSSSGTVTSDAELNTYLNNTYKTSLTQEAQNQIQKNNFKKGAVSSSATFSNILSSEGASSWNGNIALLSLSDYLKASNNTSCTSTTTPWAVEGKVSYECSNNNYLYKTAYWWWLLSPVADGSSSNYYVFSDGSLSHSGAFNSDGSVRPSVYLKSNIVFRGSGTQSDPYYIVS